MSTKKLYEIVKRHVVDSTAVVIATNPIWALAETTFLEFPDELSIKTRLLSSAFTYLGAGSILSFGRDISQRLFKIHEEARRKNYVVHDSLYLAAITGLTSPINYLAAGADIKETIYGSVASAVLALFSGGIWGYATDVFRDLTGIKKCKRLPENIRNLPKKKKLGLAGLIIASSIAVNAEIYDMTPELYRPPKVRQKFTQTFMEMVSHPKFNKDAKDDTSIKSNGRLEINEDSNSK
ncbi:MAG: hypothetical protein AABY07_10645 [Nanoarchaeota archaeon]